MSLEFEMVKVYMEHKKAFDCWKYGEPKRAWIDNNGVLCVEYANGTWFHYRQNGNNLEWW